MIISRTQAVEKIKSKLSKNKNSKDREAADLIGEIP
jgi:hypothetical protein